MKTQTMFSGTVRVLIAAAVIAPMTARLSIQKLSICSLVAADASSIMGTSAKKTKDPSLRLGGRNA